LNYWKDWGRLDNGNEAGYWRDFQRVLPTDQGHIMSGLLIELAKKRRVHLDSGTKPEQRRRKIAMWTLNLQLL